MTLAELGRRISVELEGAGEWSAGVGQDGAVTRRRGRYLGDSAHAAGVVVASREQGLSRRRAQRGGVETVEFEAIGRQALRYRRVAWAAKGARGAETRIVNQHDQDVWRTFRRAQRRDRWVAGVGVLRVIGDEAGAGLIRDWKDCSLNVVL